MWLSKQVAYRIYDLKISLVHRIILGIHLDLHIIHSNNLPISHSKET